MKDEIQQPAPESTVPDVTVVVPVSSSDAEVRKVVESLGAQLERLDLKWEAILVFDGRKGSEWNDALAMQVESDQQVRTIGFHRAFGEAVCLASAFEHARGAIILTAPEYVQSDPHGVAEMITRLQEGADVVTAKRTGRVDSILNRVQSAAFNGLLRALTGARFHDLNCSLRAFKRTVLEQLTIYGTLYRYLPVIAFRQGFRVVEVDVRHLEERGVSGIFGPMTYARRILDVLGVVFLTRFTHKPLRFFGALGGACMGAGGLIAGWVGIASWLDPSRPLFGSATFLLGVLLFVLGVQIIGFGLVGEIVIFTQARNIREYRIEGVWDG
ncbi:MAG TPA: glycosyltransferase [Planctomycetes bacterium]|nr:glycosyltransferase [Planctomycetota bacterium]HIL36936.1 glycosyltransferase [Planctomycetota bacterium]